MKYSTAINIWNVKQNDLSKLQVGQWVYAGDKTDKGIFLGVKPSGSVVCAWYRNAQNSGDFKNYVKTLRTYAKNN